MLLYMALNVQVPRFLFFVCESPYIPVNDAYPSGVPTPARAGTYKHYTHVLLSCSSVVDTGLTNKMFLLQIVSELSKAFHRDPFGPLEGT